MVNGYGVLYACTSDPIGDLLIGNDSRGWRKDIHHEVRLVGVVAEQPQMLGRYVHAILALSSVSWATCRSFSAMAPCS